MNEDQTPDRAGEGRSPNGNIDSTLPVPPDSRPLEKIGPFRILERLGSGGMGDVYLAEQTKPIKRKVALKVIKVGMDTKEVVARFEVERQAMALMDHPCIAKIYGVGETPRGRPYFVMEHVRGLPINAYCDEHQLTTDERLRLFIQVCDGVQHAHQKAIIHRDLKPGNVLVTEIDGKPAPKIIDFGVAKALGQPLTERTMFTSLGQMIGTPEFMSPEQAMLTGQDIDTRTDVYSLGVILYELLAGALPLDPTELRQAGYEKILRLIREQEPQKPSTRISTLGEQATQIAKSRRTQPRQLSREIRGDIDWITLKALEKDRARRYESPRDLAADIRRYADHLPVSASPPSTAYRLRKFVRRHRVAVITTAFFVLALAAGTIGTTIGLVRAQRAERAAVAEWQRAEAGKVFLLAKQEEYPPRALALSLRAVELSDQPEYRRLALRHLYNGPTLFRLPHTSGSHNPTSVDFSPDGKWLAVGWARNGLLNLFSRSGGEPVQLAGHEDRILRVKFSHDSSLLVTAGSDSTIRIWSPAEAELLRTWRTGGRPYPFIPDGGESVIVSVVRQDEPGHWYSWPIAAGDPVDLGTTGPRNAHHLDTPFPGLDRTGEVVAIPVGKDLEIYDLADLGNGPMAVYSAHEKPILAAFFAPDGRHLASFDLDGLVNIWDLSQPHSEPVRVLQAPDNPIFGRFDQAGERLAVGGVGAMHIWDLRQPETVRPLELFGANWMFDAAFDPLGHWIVTVSTESLVGAWPLGHQYPVTLSTGHEGLAWVEFSPDGKWLITTGDNGVVDGWQLTGRAVGERRRFYFAEDHNFWSPCFDDSSRYFFATVCNSSVGNGRIIKIPLDGGDVKTWQGGTCEVFVDPVGRFVATQRDEAQGNPYAIVIDTETNRFVSMDGAGGASWVVGFVRDGRLLGMGDNGLGLWDPTTGKGELLGINNGREMTLCPDRETLLTFDDEGRLRRGRFDDPNPTPLPLEPRCRNPFRIAVDSSADLVVSGCRSGEVEVLDEATAIRHLVPLFDEWFVGAAIDPQGRWIAAASGDEVRLCPVPSGTPIQQLSTEDFLTMTQALTSLRAARDEEAEIGYRVTGAAIPDWNKPPQWGYGR